MTQTFEIFLVVMALAAAGVFVALHFFEAGYGYLFNPKYGPPVPNKIGWIVMESPVFVLMCVLWASSDRIWETGPLALFLLFQASRLSGLLFLHHATLEVRYTCFCFFLCGIHRISGLCRHIFDILFDSICLVFHFIFRI